MSGEPTKEHPLLAEARTRNERIKAAEAELEACGRPELIEAYRHVRLIGRQAIKPAIEDHLKLLATGSAAPVRDDSMTTAIGWVMSRLALEWPRLAREWLERGGAGDADAYVVNQCLDVSLSMEWPEALTTTFAIASATRNLVAVWDAAASDFVAEQLGGKYSASDRATLAALLLSEVAKHTEEEEAKTSTRKNPALRKAIKATQAEPKHGDANPIVLHWRVSFAAHWPKVLARWRKEKDSAPTQFAVPTALFGGDGALAPFFGGTKRGHIESAPGRIRVKSGRAQADFFVEGASEGSMDQLLNILDKVLTNRAFRAFLASFYATAEEAFSGLSPPGSFWYSPTRWADLLGFAREKNGSSSRQSQENRNQMDDLMRELANVHFEGPANVGGVLKLVKAKGLITPQNVSIEDLDAARNTKGRKPEILMRISPGLLMLARGAGSYMLIPKEALRPPEGIDQRVWDDALKVYVALVSHARNNKGVAQTQKRWVRKLDGPKGLLVAVNIGTAKTEKRRVRARLFDTLLPALHKAGLVDASDEGSKITFDLPHPTGRATLAAIPHKEAPSKPK